MRRALSLLCCLVLLSLAPGAALAETAVPSVPQDEVIAFVSETIARLAAAEEEPWARFILQQGAADIAPALDAYDVSKGKVLSVTLLLKSGNPLLKEQTEYAGDPAAYLEKVTQTMLAAYDTAAKLAVTVTPTEDGFAYSLAAK